LTARRQHGVARRALFAAHSFAHKDGLSGQSSFLVDVVSEITGAESVDTPEAPAINARPQLIYDGDCGFCGYWARYWQKLTGDSVEYRPYQQVLAQYPAIPEAEFQRAVQFIAPDGERASGAEASFLTLGHARGKGLWLALYRHMPGFAPVSERAYAFNVGCRQADQRRSQLAESLGAQLPFSDAAAADAARVVRGTAAGERIQGRNRSHVCRRARSADLIFFPRRLRFAAGFGILLLEACILLTGNYNWPANGGTGDWRDSISPGRA
jgi:predicted DCC family thiol-disulfide oxidoreductase YuxK